MTDGASLIVGADSQIGNALRTSLLARGRRAVGTTRRPHSPESGLLFLDLNEDVSHWSIPENLSTAYLCAAVTAQDDCRRDPAGSRRINVDHTVALARRLVARNGFVVFFSTNLVFDGRTPWQPSDAAPQPQTEYGRQKAAAEQTLLDCSDAVAVVRFSKIVPPRWPLVVGWTERLLRGKTVRPFSDVRFAPVPLDSAVGLAREIGERRIPGIFQLSGNEDVSYEDVARWAARRSGAAESLVQGMTAAAAGQNYEAIPRHTTLDSRRVGELFGIDSPDVWTTIRESLEA